MNKYKYEDITKQSQKLCFAALSGLNHLEFELIRLNKSALNMAIKNKILSAWMLRGIKKRLWVCDVTNSQFENLLKHNKRYPLTLDLSVHFKFLVDHHFLHTKVNEFIDPNADIYQLLLDTYDTLAQEGHKVIIGMSTKEGESRYYPTEKHEFFIMENDMNRCIIDNRLMNRMPIYATGQSSDILVNACFKHGLIPVRSNQNTSTDGKEISARFLIYPFNACVDSPLNIIGLSYIRPSILSVPEESHIE